MKYRWDKKYLYMGITAFTVIAASMLFYFGIFRMGSIIAGIRKILTIFMPIIYGAIIAYLLNPIVNAYEKKLVYPVLYKKKIHPSKKVQKAIRYTGVLLALFVMIWLLYTLVMMILPEMIKSIVNIIYNFPSYISSIQDWITRILENNQDLNSLANDMFDKYSMRLENYLTQDILPQLQNTVRQISAGVFDMLTFFKNLIIGAIVSVYILADKEGFVGKCKMVVYSLLAPEHANRLILNMRFTHKTFGGFISGKLLDSLIIGILCYLGTSIIGTPYAILVSVIVGVTNVIPFFGPYLGAIPCAMLILLVDPLQCLYFILFILVLQQFDGNILGPKILGDSTGLSSFMVIVAILVGGGLFGIFGMFVGVPVCAVAYALLWRAVSNSLKYKHLPQREEEYRSMDRIDPASHRILPMQEFEDSPKKDHAEKMLLKFVGWFSKNAARKLASMLMRLSEFWAIKPGDSKSSADKNSEADSSNGESAKEDQSQEKERKE